MSEYSEMLSKLNEIVNLLREHKCENKNCCVKSLLQDIDFEQ
jgi:hypothetical protein